MEEFQGLGWGGGNFGASQLGLENYTRVSLCAIKLLASRPQNGASLPDAISASNQQLNGREFTE
jgi:hypothetical protein